MRSSVLLLCMLVSAGAAQANKTPTVSDPNWSTNEDETLNATIEASDGDGDSLTYRITVPAKNGEVSVTPQGKLTYKPKKDFHGKDTFTFEVSDGKAKLTQKGNIDVSSSNDAPTSGPVELKGVEDKQAKGQITAKDVD